MDNTESRVGYDAEMLRNAVCPECEMAHLPVSDTERCSAAIRDALFRQMQGMSAAEQVAHFARMYGH